MGGVSLMVDQPNRELSGQPAGGKRKRTGPKAKSKSKSKPSSAAADASAASRGPFSQTTRHTAKSAAEQELEELVFGADDFDRVEDLMAGKVGKEWLRLAADGGDQDDDDDDDDDELSAVKAEGAGVQGLGDTDLEAEQGLIDDDVDDDDEFADLFVVDTKKARVDGGDHDDDLDESATRNHDEDGTSDKEEQQKNALPPLASVWEDPDDENLKVDISALKRTRKLRTSEQDKNISAKEYEMRLRLQFERLHPPPKWAVCDPTMNNDLDFMTSTESIIQKSRSFFKPERIQMTKCRNANQEDYAQGSVVSLDWHPNGQVLSTASRDDTLRLFQIDGKHNPKLQSMHFPNFHLLSSLFLPSGKEMIVTGRRSYFYSFDVESSTISKISGIRGVEVKSLEKCATSPCGKYIAVSGRDGYVHLLSSLSKQLISSLKMNSPCNDLVFSNDGNIWTAARNEMFLWDMRYLKADQGHGRQMDSEIGCLGKWVDEGSIHTTTINISPNGKYLATGQNTGVVNIYKAPLLSSVTNPAPKPIKALLNLTTTINQVDFHPTSQVMAFSSVVKTDQLKMCHLGTGNIYGGWPKFNTPLGKVTQVKFGTGSSESASGWLAVGNEKGKVGLWRVEC